MRVAAIIILLIDAVRKRVVAVIGSSCPTSRVPTPAAKRRCPSITIAIAPPGLPLAVKRVPHAARSASKRFSGDGLAANGP
jgi:hypothetical protein